MSDEYLRDDIRRDMVRAALARHKQSQPSRPPADPAAEREPARPGPAPDAKPASGGSQQGGDARQRNQQNLDQKRGRARPLVRFGLVVVLIAMILGGAWYWFSTKDLVSTDDAYTDGRAVVIAPHVNGYVVSLDVNDNQLVHKGDPIIHIDPRDYQAAVDQAKANLLNAEGQLSAARFGTAVARKNFPAQLAAAEANLAAAKAAQFKAQTDYRRQHNIPREATTQQDVDYATSAAAQADAQVQQAEAQVRQSEPVEQNIGQSEARITELDGGVKQAQAALEQAQLNLGWTVLTAPQDGWVTKRNVEVGNYVQQGAQIMSLVSPEVWITANFKEDQLNRMRPGQHVTIDVDAYPNLKLEGHVDSVQLGSGSKFTAFPPENATGNYVKIVQRVPVKIVIDKGLDPNLPLPLGLSVSPTVDVGD